MDVPVFFIFFKKKLKLPTYKHFIMTFKEILLLCIFSKETRALLNDSNHLFSYSFIYLFVKIDCSTVIA